MHVYSLNRELAKPSLIILTITNLVIHLVVIAIYTIHDKKVRILMITRVYSETINSVATIIMFKS